MSLQAKSALTHKNVPNTVALRSCAVKISEQAISPENITNSRSPPINRLSRLPALRIGVERMAMKELVGCEGKSDAHFGRFCRGCDFSAATKEAAHHILSTDQQSHN